MSVIRSKSGQAMPDKIIPIGSEAFENSGNTVIRWLSGAGSLINSHGTVIMIDPLLDGFDMPQLVSPPISPADVSRIDALLITHIDADHYSVPTCRALKSVCKSIHAPHYVADEMNNTGIDGTGHDIGSSFYSGEVKITLTPVDHTWQNDYPEYGYRKWTNSDYCGYCLETPEGIIWMPSDSRLLDEHLHMPFKPDVILFDFSEDSWHISFEGAVKLADAYPSAKLICIHWGTVDAPLLAPFNSDPTRLADHVNNPERIFILRPGEPFCL